MEGVPRIVSGLQCPGTGPTGIKEKGGPPRGTYGSQTYPPAACCMRSGGAWGLSTLRRALGPDTQVRWCPSSVPGTLTTGSGCDPTHSPLPPRPETQDHFWLGPSWHWTSGVPRGAQPAFMEHPPSAALLRPFLMMLLLHLHPNLDATLESHGGRAVERPPCALPNAVSCPSASVRYPPKAVG